MFEPTRTILSTILWSFLFAILGAFAANQVARITDLPMIPRRAEGDLVEPGVILFALKSDSTGVDNTGNISLEVSKIYFGYDDVPPDSAAKTRALRFPLVDKIEIFRHDPRKSISVAKLVTPGQSSSTYDGLLDCRIDTEVIGVDMASPDDKSEKTVGIAVRLSSITTGSDGCPQLLVR